MSPARRKPAETTSPPAQFLNTDIPRRRNANGSEGGPYVLHPGAKRSFGEKKCETCGRMVEPDRRHPRKGKCRCLYYQRCTTFIDVLQDEYLLKQWGNRNVAWGMGQRRDLQLAAATCKPDSDQTQTLEDKRELNKIAKEAQDVAAPKMKASIGTSLHKLTHMMDRGETLGYVPPEWEGDLKAYEEATKDIEWLQIETFRVYDGWVDKACKHIHPRNKEFDPEFPCKCYGIAGTADRIGLYKGRVVIMDIKTGSIWDQLGKAMQLAMYARSTPYIIATDERTVDEKPIDLSVGYIIHLPEGEGRCDMIPTNISAGWGACKVAKQVWGLRKDKFFMDESRIKKGRTLLEMAKTAGSIEECKILWRNGKSMGELTDEVKAALNVRADELKAAKKEADDVA
jgi:hypothetical protein